MYLHYNAQESVMVDNWAQVDRALFTKNDS